jgi:hypothetical protein
MKTCCFRALQTVVLSLAMLLSCRWPLLICTASKATSTDTPASSSEGQQGMVPRRDTGRADRIFARCKYLSAQLGTLLGGLPVTLRVLIVLL